MNAHTPAPWRIITNRPGERTFRTVVRDFGPHHHATICEMNNDDTADDEEHAANALLITAAPELLAALQSLLAITEEPLLGDLADRQEMARAAIARAEGAR